MREPIGNRHTVAIKYPYIRIAGLWLILIGSVIMTASIVGGTFELNPIIFMIGYGISLYLTEGCSYVKRRLKLKGELTTHQMKMSKYGVFSLFPLMFIMGGAFIPGGNWRMVWLGTLMATGIHFLFFIPVHGRLMLYLAVVCTVIPVFGLVFPNVPFLVFGILDGVTKIAFGLYLLLRRHAEQSG